MTSGRLLFAVSSAFFLSTTGCGSLIYNCKANDTQCKEKVAALDRATTEIAIEATASAIESVASSAESEHRAPPRSEAAASTPVPAVAAAPAPTSPSSSTDDHAAPPPAQESTLDEASTLRELHVAVHFARMCKGDSVGAVSGQVSIEPSGAVHVKRMVGPGIKDTLVARCVRNRIETAAVPPFAGDVRTATLVFDVDPNEDLPTPKEAAAPIPKK